MPQTASTQRIAPELIIRQDDSALVYLSNESKLHVRFELREGTVLSLECQSFLSKVRISEAVSATFLSLENRHRWKRMLGEAMALAIGGDLRSAEKVATDADKFLGDRAGEAARMWYVQACLALIAVLMLMYGIFDVSLQISDSTDASASSQVWSMDEDDTYTYKYILLAVIAGAVGAGFSILIRIGKLNIDPSAGRNAHYGEVLFRLTIGALAGAIIIIGWQAEVFGTFMKTQPGELGDVIVRASQSSFSADFWKMTILALVAGASERLVPSLLQQLASRTADDESTQSDSDAE